MSTPGKPFKPPPRPERIIRSTSDFARYVGLARTTVSRVLNGHPGLKSQTVERVQRAIEETGFTPNAYALHLKGKRTATVGICMETFLTAPAVLKLAALQRRLRERSHASLIEVLQPGGSREVIRHFLSMRVDAVVFLGHFVEEEVARRGHELSTHGTPHLVIDQLGIPGVDTVALDRVQAMRDVMNHLLDLGHTTFGLLGINGTTRSVRDRLAGIETALAARGLNLEQATLTLDHLHARDNDFKYGRALAGSFVAEKTRPTAYVALNDEVAIGAMHGFQEAGLRVPQDVSVAGFNNQDICLMPTPMLTSVDQQVQATVDAAVDALLAQIGQPHRTHPIVRTIAPVLVKRESTGSCASAKSR